MRLRSLILLLSIVSATAIAVVFLLPDPPEVRRSSALAPRETPSMDPESAQGGELGPVPGGTQAPAPSAEIPAGRPEVALDVLVHETDGRAAPGVTLRARSTVGPHVEGLAVEDDRKVDRVATTDEEGRARLDALPVGPYTLVAEGPDGRRSREEVCLALERREARLTLPERALERDLVVRVLDVAAKPVSAARVEIYGGVAGSQADRVGTVPALAGTTGEDGTARFADVEFEGGAVVATAPDGRAGLSTAPRPQGPVVTVAEPGVLEGGLIGQPAERFLDARVLAYALDRHEPYAPTHGLEVSAPVVDGRYRFEALPAGTWSLALDDPGGGRIVLPPATISGRPLRNSVDPLEVQVLPGRTVEHDLETTDGGSIEGRVVTEAGHPVEGALVRATLVPETSTLPDGFTLHGVHVWRFDSRLRAPGDHPVTHRSAGTDAIGSYRFAGLPPGRHRIEVLAAGLSYDRRESVEVEDRERTILEHVLRAAGTLQGLEPRAGLVGVRDEERSEVLMIALLPRDGRFTFGGLAPGSYVVCQFQADSAVPPVALTTVLVEAGRTTWIDLSAAERPVRLAGRVLDAHGPVAGARVRLDPETRITDQEGRFEMRSSFPLTDPITLQILRGSVETWFTLAGMPPGTTPPVQDLVLGDEVLRLRTLDESGTPASARVEIAAVELASSGGDVEAIRFEPVFVDESGERLVPGILPGVYVVRARFENGAEVQADVSIPEAASVVLRRPPSSDLEVLLLDADGAPVLGKWIAVETRVDAPAATSGRASTQEPVRRWRESDVDGRARFRGVTAGDVRIQVRASRSVWAGEEAVLASEQLELAAGEDRKVELVLRDP